MLDVIVSEQKAKGFGIKTIDKPDYIKKYLDEVMRENRNIRGLNHWELYIYLKKVKN